MNFNHICYTTAEAENEATRQLAAIPTFPKKVGPFPVWLAVFLTGLGIFVLIPCVTTDTTPQWIILPWIGVAVVTFAATGWVRARDTDNENAALDIKHSFRPARQEDLRWLLDQCMRFTDVDAAVRSWLADGKAIRYRDITAVEEYVDQVEPEALDAALRGDPEARAQFAQQPDADD